MGDNNNKKPILSDLEKNNKKPISKSNDNKKSLNNNNLGINNNTKDIKKGISSKKVDNVVKNNNNTNRPTNLANTDLKKVLEAETKFDSVQKNVKQQSKKEFKKDNISVNKDNQQKSPQNQKPQNVNNNVIVNNSNNIQNNSVVAATDGVALQTKKPRKRKKWKPGDPGYDPLKDTKLQKKLARAEAIAQKKVNSWPQGINPNYKGNNYDPDYYKKKKQNYNKDNKQQSQNEFKNKRYNPFQRDYRNLGYTPFRKGGFYLKRWRPSLLEFDVYHFAKVQKHPALVERMCRKNWESLRDQAFRYNLLTNKPYFYKKNKFAGERFPRDKNQKWGWKSQIKKKPIQREEDTVLTIKKGWKESTYFRLKLESNRKKIRSNKDLSSIISFPIRANNSTKFLTFIKALVSSKKGFFLLSSKYARLGSNIPVLLTKNQGLKNLNQDFFATDFPTKVSSKERIRIQNFKDVLETKLKKEPKNSFFKVRKALKNINQNFDLPEELFKKVSLTYARLAVRKYVRKKVKKGLPALKNLEQSSSLKPKEMRDKFAFALALKQDIKPSLESKTVQKSFLELGLLALEKRPRKVKKKLRLSSKKKAKKFSKKKRVLKFLAKSKTKVVRKRKTTADLYFPKLDKKEIYQEILTPVQLRKLIRMENIKTKNLNFFARIVNHRAAFKQKGGERPWYDRRWWRYNKRIYDLNIDVSHIFMSKYRNFIFRKVPNLWVDTVALLALVRKGQIDGGAYHDAMITHYRRLYKKHHYGFEQMQRGLSRFLFGRQISVQIWQDPSPIYKDMLKEHEYIVPKDYVTPKNEQEGKKLEILAEKKIRFVKLSSDQDAIAKKYLYENKLTNRSFLRGYGVEVAGRIGAKPRGKYFFQFGGNVGRQTTHTRAYGFENAADSLKYGSYGIKLFMRPKELTFRTRKLHAKMSRIIALRDEFVDRNVKKLYRFTFVKEDKAINQNAIKDSVKYREILVKNSSENTLLNEKNHLIGKKFSPKLKRVALLKENYNNYLNRLEKVRIEKNRKRQKLNKENKVAKRKSKLKKVSSPVKKRFKLIKITKTYSLIMKQQFLKMKKKLKMKPNKNKNKNKKSNNKVNKYDKTAKRREV